MNFPLHAISLSLLMAVTSAFSQQATKKKPHPDGPLTSIPKVLLDRLEEKKEVVYAKYGDREMALDWYRPKSAAGKKLPAIVCIHGGGWWQGNRENHGRLAQALADQGFFTATISYRLSGEAPFPAAIQDCKAAVRFLRANAESLGIQSDKIGAIGLSAGGHLTALLATSAGVAELEGEGGNADQSSAIQAAVPMGAQTDFSRHHENIEKSAPNPVGEKPNIWVQFMGGKPSEAPERWKLASPITHLEKSDPAMLFVTGEHDNESTHAEKFRSQMKAAGISEKLVIIPGAPHAFPGRQKFFDQMIPEATAWFETHLK